jgi:hypothetical protein
MAYGLTILIFGLLFLLSNTGVLEKMHGEGLIGAGPFFLIAGIIFLLTSGERLVGIMSTAIGAFIIANSIWFHIYPLLLVPVLLITVGVVMIVLSKT